MLHLFWIRKPLIDWSPKMFLQEREKSFVVHKTHRTKDPEFTGPSLLLTSTCMSGIRSRWINCSRWLGGRWLRWSSWGRRGDGLEGFLQDAVQNIFINLLSLCILPTWLRRIIFILLRATTSSPPLSVLRLTKSLKHASSSVSPVAAGVVRREIGMRKELVKKLQALVEINLTVDLWLVRSGLSWCIRIENAKPRASLIGGINLDHRKRLMSTSLTMSTEIIIMASRAFVASSKNWTDPTFIATNSHMNRFFVALRRGVGRNFIRIPSGDSDLGPRTSRGWIKFDHWEGMGGISFASLT